MVTIPDEALALIAAICALPQNATFMEETEELVRSAGIARAVAERDTPVLYAWLMGGFSYQGISDSNAESYIAKYGNADWFEIESGLAEPRGRCPKLDGFDAYRGCGYRKTIRTCGNPEALGTCPVPSLPLRKGSLNEQAFSLFFFIRDRCGGDLVGFLENTISSGADGPDPISSGREALLSAFGEVCGVSRKLLSMMLSTLLIGADPERAPWVAVGCSMVAVDSLVHNHLHRTGILAAYGAHHRYGQRCFAENGCEAIIRDLAGRFDTRSVNPRYPASFPRMVQHAIWRFCAASELNTCNGRNIKDDVRCALDWCPLWSRCSRLPLRSPSQGEERR
jgi:hypothetical protein